MRIFIFSSNTETIAGVISLLMTLVVLSDFTKNCLVGINLISCLHLTEDHRIYIFLSNSTTELYVESSHASN